MFEQLEGLLMISGPHKYLIFLEQVSQWLGDDAKMLHELSIISGEP
jgi:hypothetical protein